MIDITNEKIIRLIDVPDFVPSCRKGKKIGKATCFKWARHGAGNVKLETIRVGGSRLTSVEAIQRFIDAQNEVEPQSFDGSRKQSKERAEKAAAALTKLGI